LSKKTVLLRPKLLDGTSCYPPREANCSSIILTINYVGNLL
jgi:hypothetical protein